MGRPFDDELGRLAASYSYACHADITPLVRLASSSLDAPLIAVGSGGSYTAAAFLGRLHSKATGGASAAMTPLELEAIQWIQPEASIWIQSAGGKNNDILTAAEAAIVLEPSAIISLTTTASTPLERRLAATPMGHAFAFPSPAGRDGYLATNSLLITIVILHRAFSAALGTDCSLPAFSELVNADRIIDAVADFDQSLRPLWKREQILLIHDAASAVGAIDLESKITEAALGIIKVSDIRNFAHGRHHWLSRYGEQSGVLAFTSSDKKALAERTIRLFPSDVPTNTIELRYSDQIGDIEAVIKAFLLTASLGHSKSVDPGRPGVAEFGSKIYRMSRRRTPKETSTIASAALRKKAAGASTSPAQIEKAAKRALLELQSITVGAIVFDLDGTLVSHADRWSLDARAEFKSALSEILRNGVTIGVATGRAPSKKTMTLVRSFFPKRFWPSTVVGYHNGAIIGALADDGFDPSLGVQDDHRSAFEQLERELIARLQEYSNDIMLDVSDCQLTLRSATASSVVRPKQLLRIAHEAIAVSDAPMKVICSTHSVDVVSAATSKRNVVDRIKVATSDAVLRFGDMGNWPGNDFELLADSHGISVDRVSPDLRGCWNFLPRGVRSTEGLLYYLNLLKSAGKNRLRFSGLER